MKNTRGLLLLYRVPEFPNREPPLGGNGLDWDALSVVGWSLCLYQDIELGEGIGAGFSPTTSARAFCRKKSIQLYAVALAV